MYGEKEAPYMETSIDLPEVIQSVSGKIQELPFQKDTIRNYLRCCEEIACYYKEQPVSEFGIPDAVYLCNLKCPEMKCAKAKDFRKVAFTIAAYCESGIFIWKRTETDKYPLSKCYAQIANAFKTELSKTLGAGTVRGGLVITRQFLFFLESIGVASLKNLTIQDVLAFIAQESPSHKASMAKLTRTIRKFIAYLKNVGVTDIEPRQFIVHTAKRRQKVLPCFSRQNLNATFASIDLSTSKGKRDYAVILMALRTGLRASDIVKLKLEDIDWHNNTIQVVQKKTATALILPLPTDVGNAIANYILESRIQCENPYIFQRIKNPELALPINPTAFNGYLRSYMEKAGVNRTGWDGKTFHALRRTAGTTMVSTGIPVSTVAQVLGHRSIESSKRYIRLDVEHLRECCMDINHWHTQKGGLY